MISQDFYTLKDELQKAESAILICDYDGTLAPFVENRFQAYTYPGIIPRLEKIRTIGDEIAVVTGRPISEILDLMPLAKHLEVWASHGMQHKLADGALRNYPLSSRVEDILKEAFEWCRKTGFENRLDWKHGSLAIHWRGLPVDDAAEISSQVKNSWQLLIDVSNDVNIHEFDGGLELRAAGRDKGSAVKELLGKQRTGKLFAAFIGDDLTDEDAFRAIKDHGYGILVREEYRETEAEFWIKPPGELYEFLDMWIDSRI